MSQCRIACLRIPKFQIAAHQKHDAALKDKSFVIFCGQGNKARILLCSNEAEKKKIHFGMRLSEARAACSDVICLNYEEALYSKVQNDLLQELIIRSPKITAIEPGVILLDASGLSHLGGEEQFCKNIADLVSKAAFADFNIGIADSAFTAILASRYKKKRYYIVDQGQDKEFLAPFSVQQLPANLEMHETLIEMGIKTLGQLQQFPLQELKECFGEEGLIAHDLVCGQDPRYPQLLTAEKSFFVFCDLGFPVEALSQTQFILKSMLDKLSLELAKEGLRAEELILSFFNDITKFDERPLKLLRPSNSSKFLLEIIKLALEAKPLAREFTSIQIQVSEFSQESWKQNKVKISQPEPSQLVVDLSTLADSEPLDVLRQRFATKLGPQSLVCSLPNDQHLPDFSGKWLPVIHDPADGSILPINISHDDINSPAPPSRFACGLVLKKIPRPEPVLIEYQGQKPTAITYQGRWYHIQELTEPEKLSGLWWEKPIQKSYYVAWIEPRLDKASSSNQSNLLETTTCESYLVLLVHDHRTRSWQLEGFFD